MMLKKKYLIYLFKSSNLSSQLFMSKKILLISKKKLEKIIRTLRFTIVNLTSLQRMQISASLSGIHFGAISMFFI